MGPQDSQVEEAQRPSNLAIDNRFKAILLMDYDQDKKKLSVVENTWKKAVEHFQTGAFVHKKYGK